MGQRGNIPRKIKGFRDVEPEAADFRQWMVETICNVYRSYGFEHWDTPALEYADCLGKYLPDADSVAQGVFSFRNPEEEPILDTLGKPLRDEKNNVLMENHFTTLRYDLTAPLARLYAEMLWNKGMKKIDPNTFKPPLLRRYQYGPVYRFEAKLDPGRYREFWQLDFDTVGVADSACDAEACCILCDALEALGIERGMYEARINNRKLHRGLFEKVGIAGQEQLEQDVMRVIDKVDKIGADGVVAELGKGRKDQESGAFIDGLGLSTEKIDPILGFLQSCIGQQNREVVLENLTSMLGDTPSGREGIEELQQIHSLLQDLGYQDDRVVFDPSVARGMAYYTGPVFEVVSKMEYKDEKGRVRPFGSISGGGRYDGLVKRLLNIEIPATGASIGVDRLMELLRQMQAPRKGKGPVLIVMFDEHLKNEYHRMAMELRRAGIAAEVYYGIQRKMKAQMSYADSKDAPIAVLAGEDEMRNGTVSLKDLTLGKRLAEKVKERSEWQKARPAQQEVARDKLVESVADILKAQQNGE